jgi:hypothetical protein
VGPVHHVSIYATSVPASGTSLAQEGEFWHSRPLLAGNADKMIAQIVPGCRICGPNAKWSGFVSFTRWELLLENFSEQPETLQIIPRPGDLQCIEFWILSRFLKK